MQHFLTRQTQTWIGWNSICRAYPRTCEMAQRCPEQILRHKSLTSHCSSQDSECTKSMMIALTIGPGKNDMESRPTKVDSSKCRGSYLMLCISLISTSELKQLYACDAMLRCALCESSDAERLYYIPATSRHASRIHESSS